MLLLDLSNTATRCIGAVTFYSVLHYLVADERLMRGTVGYCRLSCRLWTSYMKSFDCTTYRDTALSVFTSQRSTTGKVATLPRFTAQTKSTALLGAIWSLFVLIPRGPLLFFIAAAASSIARGLFRTAPWAT